jgi:hypothetical protein
MAGIPTGFVVSAPAFAAPPFQASQAAGPTSRYAHSVENDRLFSGPMGYNCYTEHSNDHERAPGQHFGD